MTDIFESHYTPCIILVCNISLFVLIKIKALQAKAEKKPDYHPARGNPGAPPLCRLCCIQEDVVVYLYQRM